MSSLRPLKAHHSQAMVEINGTRKQNFLKLYTMLSKTEFLTVELLLCLSTLSPLFYFFIFLISLQKIKK